MRLPRSALMRPLPARDRSSPAKARRRALFVAAFGRRSMIASEVMDLPQPDSPTRQSVSPRLTEKEMSRTACSVPPAVLMSTLRPSTSRTMSLELAMPSAPSFGGDDVAQAVTGEIDGEDEQRQRRAGDRDEPEGEEHVGLRLRD